LASLRLVLGLRIRRILRAFWWAFWCTIAVVWWVFWSLIDEITEGSDLD